MDREAGKMPEEHLNQLLIQKASDIMHELGILDLRSSIQEDGVHFFVTLPEEHLETRREQMQSLGGALEATEFQRRVVVPFVKRFREEYDEYLECTFLPTSFPGSDLLEFVITRKRYGIYNR